MCSETPKVSILSRKRQKRSPEKLAGDSNLFESLPDDLVLSILTKLSSTATSPSDFISVLITYVKKYVFFFVLLIFLRLC